MQHVICIFQTQGLELFLLIWMNNETTSFNRGLEKLRITQRILAKCAVLRRGVRKLCRGRGSIWKLGIDQ